MGRSTTIHRLGSFMMSEYDDPELPRRHRLMRRFAILFVSIVATLAIVYDYTIARPSVDQAHDRINSRLDAFDASLSESLSHHDVRELLQKQPSRIFRDGGKHVEVFSWIAGFPLRTHDLYVVYDQNGRTTSLIRHFKFAYRSDRHYRPERSAVPPDSNGSTTTSPTDPVASDIQEATANARDDAKQPQKDGNTEKPSSGDATTGDAGKLPNGRSGVTKGSSEAP